MKFEDTGAYKLGRNGEILMHAFAIEHGCTTFDISGTAHGRAPLLHSRSRNIIAPDALHLRNHPIWAEYKTKSYAFDWRGGARESQGRTPPCLAHGIDLRAFRDYERANVQIPVVLWFLTINTGMLHIASLDELGKPFDSADHNYPIVNWPISRMKRVAAFDRGRVRQFVNAPPRPSLPADQQRKELLHWLRPVQVEFDGFAEHFLIDLEHRWAARGTAQPALAEIAP
jgi:hypothetical protein